MSKPTGASGNTPLHEKGLWFYVPVYSLVRDLLNEAYAKFKVEEWSAEPGRVGVRPDDADIVVIGEMDDLLKFWDWLKTSGIVGLMIEGEEVG